MQQSSACKEYANQEAMLMQAIMSDAERERNLLECVVAQVKRLGEKG